MTQEQEAHHDRIRRWVSLPWPARQVWGEIGGFGDIAAWHPLIDKAELVDIEGEPHRHLTTSDGDLIMERLVETGPHHYSYEIIDSHLPVDNFRATLSCVVEDEGCHVFWSAVFDPTDPLADEVISGMFEEGLRGLRDRFGG